MAVIRSKDASTLHLPTIVANSTNAILWSVYGLGIEDWNLLIPNGTSHYSSLCINACMHACMYVCIYVCIDICVCIVCVCEYAVLILSLYVVLYV